MKGIVSSDWHGDASTLGIDRHDDIAAAVAETVNAAIDEKVDAYFMLGDLTDPDTHRCHAAIGLAAEVTRELVDNGIRVFFVVGNHDVVEDGTGAHTMMALEPAGAQVFDRPNAIVFGDIVIVALPFTPSSHSYDPAEFISRVPTIAPVDKLPTLVVGHLNLKDAVHGSESGDMSRGRDVWWPIDAIEEHLPNALVVGGHYHKGQKIGGVHIVGSLARLRADESTNDPSFLLLEV